MGTHFYKEKESLGAKITIIAIIILGVIVASSIVYILNTRLKIENNMVLQEKEVSQREEKDDDFELVSIDIGKTVDEAEKELNNTTNENSKSNANSSNTKAKDNTNSTNKLNTTANSNNKSNTTTSNNEVDNKNTIDTIKNSTSENTKTQDKKEEVKFEAPIKGDIIREFAPDSLVYSETLGEWVTHNGIDIKANKTSVVKACAKGKVTSIKTDPRYGLTVIVNHDNGYQTIYANLLTAEYVVEGEEIELGQTIGTVGNTANFEIADEYHLHFEMMKDGDYINPSNCIGL